MAAIDYAKFPESTWQSLLAASYKLTLELFKDPAVRAEYEVWREKRKAAQRAAERKEEKSETKELPLPDVEDREAANKGEQSASDYPREIYHDDGHLSNGGISWVTE